MKKLFAALAIIFTIIAVITVNSAAMNRAAERLTAYIDKATNCTNSRDFDAAKNHMETLLHDIEANRTYFGLVTSKVNLEEIESSACRASEYCKADSLDEYYAEALALRHHILHMAACESFSLHTIL